MDKPKRTWTLTLRVPDVLAFAAWVYLAGSVTGYALQGAWSNAAAATVFLILGTVGTWDLMRPTLFAWALGERSTILTRDDLDQDIER